MSINIKKLRISSGYVLMALLAIGVGLYPLRFIGLPYDQSLLGDKPALLLESNFYISAFFTHIFLGGLALIAGFSQFFKKLRMKRLGLHRALGKIYVIAVLLSGFAGIYIAYHASGGIVASAGFTFLGILWLFTTYQAYISIKDKQIQEHQKWMIRSYALCFAAVTLRLYLPISLIILHVDFIPAYKAIAWLCWVPNLLVAEYLIIRKWL